MYSGRGRTKLGNWCLILGVPLLSGIFIFSAYGTPNTIAKNKVIYKLRNFRGKNIMSKFSKSFCVFAMGFFAIAAQALLFRQFITSFESNDIAVAMFFGSWFLWIACSAWLFGKWEAAAAKCAKHIDILLLCYIPAFILQLTMIVQAREIAGIASYSIFPLKSMLLMAILVNFPVSFITGVVFPGACKYLQEQKKIPVSSVYLLEAVGSVSGGLAVTLLLFCEINIVMIFLLSSLLISIAVFVVQYATANKKIFLLLPVLILACICVRIDKPCLQKMQILKWSKLLPEEAFKGAFSTAQAEYLYGKYNGQLLIARDGAVCATLPDKEAAATTIAINLSQHSGAENILIVGEGLNICRELLVLPQIKHIAWGYPDNQFIRKVMSFIPDEYQCKTPRIKLIKKDIRSFLATDKYQYDIVIINIPAPDSSSLNRYFTAQFFSLLKQVLSPEGIVGINMSGGENVMGAELAYLGASTKATLKTVFKKVVIKSGEKMWFIASDNSSITDNPERLSQNFAGYINSAEVFPSEGLFSLYFPDRSADAQRIYNSVDLPMQFLINSDVKPHVYLYELLLSLKKSGINAVRNIKNLLYAGLTPFMVTVVMFLIIWIIYAKTASGCLVVAESSMLVFISGMLGIGLVIILMYQYQTRYGSLYLYLGLISSLFMIGLTSGAALARFLTVKRKIAFDKLLFLTIILQILIFSIIAFGKPYLWSQLSFVFAFLLPGICNGLYFPIAAARLNETQLTNGKAGSKLENADHLGAAVGALFTGMCLIPILGTQNTLILFTAILTTMIPIVLIRTYINKNALVHTAESGRKSHLGDKGVNMISNTNGTVFRNILFLMFGAIVLILTFLITVKVTGDIPPSSSVLPAVDTAMQEAPTSQKRLTVEDALGAPPATEKYVPSDVKKVNLKKIKKMIEEKKLSDHEAEFYKKLNTIIP
jgi:predicted membrane-bound spermidine synthase